MRTLLIEEYEEALKICDVLLGPVTPGLPSKIGEMISDPLSNLLEDLYTDNQSGRGSSFSYSGRFYGKGLPVGLQIIGKKFGEGELFQFGYLYLKRPIGTKITTIN